MRWIVIAIASILSSAFLATETVGQSYQKDLNSPAMLNNLLRRAYTPRQAWGAPNRFNSLFINFLDYKAENSWKNNENPKHQQDDPDSQYHFNRTGVYSPCAEESWLSTALGIGMFVTISVIIIGGLGNTLTILILVHQMCQVHAQQKIRTTASTVLVLNLAIADLCYSVVCLPFIFAIYYIVYTSDLDLVAPLDHGFGQMCRFSAFIRYTNAISEWTTIGLMALERFITISRYSKWQKGGNKWFTPRKSAYYCIFIWILGSLFQLPTLLELGQNITFFGQFGYNIDTLKCDFVGLSEEELEGFGMREFFFLLEAAIPCCLILVGYIAIILKIKNSTRFMRQFGTQDCQMRVAMRNSKTTGLCFRLIFVYLVCVVPICVWNVSIPEKELGEPCNQIWGIYLYLIYWLQYAINNFIYALSLPQYGKAAKQFFSSLIPQISRSDTQSFTLKKNNRKEQMVSVISIDQRSGPLSYHSHCSPGINPASELSSHSHESTSLFLSRLFSSQKCVDGCSDCSTHMLDASALEEKVFIKNYITSFPTNPKHSVNSEWSFSASRFDTQPSYDFIFARPLNRKRSSSDVGQGSTLRKKLQRQLSF